MRVLLRLSPHQPEAKKDYRASGSVVGGTQHA